MDCGLWLGVLGLVWGGGWVCGGMGCWLGGVIGGGGGECGFGVCGGCLVVKYR